jgi:hypothetical protein
MLVKAKWNVKDASGWHGAGDVFETEDNLGNAVEILDAPKVKAADVVKAVEEQDPAKEEVKAEKPKAATRRKRISE